MKIVHSYIVRNDIKAITIEESKDKLVITPKTPHNEISMPLQQNQTFDEDIEIKKEPDDELEYSENKDTNVTIKHELEMNIDDNYEERTDAFTEDQQPAVPDLHAIPIATPDLSRLELLLKINQEILRKVNGIDTKLNAQMNLLNFNLPN